MRRKFILSTMMITIIFSLGIFVYASEVQQTPADDSGATAEGVKSVVSANNQFALDLYSKYRSNNGNIFFSPYSISMAMTMTYEGAKGKTADQIRTVFHFPQNDSLRRYAFAWVYNDLNQVKSNYTLKTANALWAQKNYPFLYSYFSIIDRYYGGNVTNLDFINDPENSRLTINNWVENQTNNKIKDLIPQGTISTDTRLIITNAIYFKGKWLTQFDPNRTTEKDFKTSDNKTVKVQMMSFDEEARFNYTETEELQVLELPYSGNELSMLLILPKDNDVSSLEESLTTEKLTGLRNNLTNEQVDVYLPKFKFETKYFMKETLEEMGMPQAFSDEADFSGMTGEKGLFISQVIHQAFVEVNEEGTEAAASTGVVINLTSMPDIKTFNADHPFIFVIQQRENVNILFLGRVADPTK